MSSTRAAPEVVRGPRRRVLAEEILIVLALSLAQSAVYSILDLVSAPVRGVTAAIYPSAGFFYQVADVLFPLVPVWLVIHLLRREREPLAMIGLTADHPWRDAGAGALLAAGVGAVGLGVYFAAVALGVNRFVNPAPPLGHWWTVPILVLGAAQAALLEEIVDVGYLVTRLQQLGWAVPAAIAASAGLRGAYHLYQGFGGFVGNLALGVLFAGIFVRWRHTWPLVVAHFLLDLGAGLGYIALRGHLPGT